MNRLTASSPTPPASNVETIRESSRRPTKIETRVDAERRARDVALHDEDASGARTERDRSLVEDLGRPAARRGHALVEERVGLRDRSRGMIAEARGERNPTARHVDLRLREATAERQLHFPIAR
ncbi:MAG: hypothetical protein ABI569_17260 [Casimicrobiaceae bacterium]